MNTILLGQKAKIPHLRWFNLSLVSPCCQMANLAMRRDGWVSHAPRTRKVHVKWNTKLRFLSACYRSPVARQASTYLAGSCACFHQIDVPNWWSQAAWCAVRWHQSLPWPHAMTHEDRYRQRLQPRSEFPVPAFQKQHGQPPDRTASWNGCWARSN